MKANFLATKLTCCLLALVLVLQSCATYKQTSISIDEAVEKKSNVAVRTTMNTKLTYDRIEKTDSIYYGIKKAKKVIRKTPIDTSKISSIHEYDKLTSTLGTIILFAIPVAIIIIIASQDYAPDFGGSGM